MITRRGFLRFLAAVPVLNRIPLPQKLYGDGFDGNATISPLYWKKYSELNLGNEYKPGDGGGGGGGPGYVSFAKCDLATFVIKVSANGGKVEGGSK